MRNVNSTQLYKKFFKLAHDGRLCHLPSIIIFFKLGLFSATLGNAQGLFLALFLNQGSQAMLGWQYRMQGLNPGKFVQGKHLTALQLFTQNCTLSVNFCLPAMYIFNICSIC